MLSAFAPRDEFDLYDVPDGAQPTLEPARTGPIRAGTGSGSSGQTNPARPGTSVAGAGYGKSVQQPTTFKQSIRPSSAVSLNVDPPEVQAKRLEESVHKLIEASVMTEDKRQSVDKAREAVKVVAQLDKLREQNGLANVAGVELGWSVQWNLGVALQSAHRWTEAIQIYIACVKTKAIATPARLRVNIGNCYYEEKKYRAAIKQYRMASDQIPSEHKQLRTLIQINIGNAFVSLREFSEASSAYELAMDQMPDVRTGLNLLVCYYATGNTERIIYTLSRLLAAKQSGLIEMDDDDYNDPVKDKQRLIKQEYSRRIVQAAKLVAPMCSSDSLDGYDVISEALRASSYSSLAGEIEMAKATELLKRKEVDRSIEVLKGLEHQDDSLLAAAATNLSFVSLMGGDLDQAKTYADLALTSNRYNSSALVNLGNVHFARKEYEKSQSIYEEALQVDSNKPQALYNLGLIHRQLNQLKEARAIFEKLQALTPKNPSIAYQLATIQEELGDLSGASKWYTILATLVPSDPGVLSRMAELSRRAGDVAQSLHLYLESFHSYPSSITVLSWLGSYHVQNDAFEKAIVFCQMAQEVDPLNTKWPLLIAACQSRAGDRISAVATYKQAHKSFPSNIDILRSLVSLCTELGYDSDVKDYVLKLKQLDKEQLAIQTQAIDDGSLAAAFGSPAVQASPKPKPIKQPMPIKQQQQHQPLTPVGPGDPSMPQFAPTPDHRRMRVKGAVDDSELWDDDDFGDELLP